jgi:hypothetical protein
MFLKWGVHKNNYESWCLKTNAVIVIIMQGAKENHGHKPKKKNIEQPIKLIHMIQGGN